MVTENMSIFQNRPALRWATLLALFVIGSAIRLSNLDSFQPGDRQFRSALISRAYYFKNNDAIPEWRNQVAEINRQRAGLLEPPIMELLVSWIYRILKHEDLAVPTLLSSFFWLIGGFLLYKIAQRVVSVDASLFTVAYYLFLPTGVFISTGFLPDSLMIMLYLLSLFLIILYHERPSNGRLLLAAAASALAILVKPLCTFAILSVFISLAICQRVDRRRFLAFHFPTFLGITLLPIIFYYSHGIIVGGSLARQAESSIIPNLLLTRSYWKDWMMTASSVVGVAPLLAALIGLPMLAQGSPRALVIGLSIGYAVFCLLFTYHIRFAPHYHSQLIIIVSLSIGPLVTMIINRLRRYTNAWYLRLPPVGALILTAVFTIRGVHRTVPTSLPLEEIAVFQEIGETVNHSTRVVHLSTQYGMPLQYYGELSGLHWPRSASDSEQALGITGSRSLEDRLNALPFHPEYFVVTDFEDFYRHHTDLKAFLEKNCSIRSGNENYLICRDCMGTQ